MEEWTEGDFSQYNHAGIAKYSISENGKVDIMPEKEGKLGLSKQGMYKLVKDWITESSSIEIKAEQRKELIELLSK